MLDKSNERKYIVSRIDSMKDKFKAIEKELDNFLIAFDNAKGHLSESNPKIVAYQMAYQNGSLNLKKLIVKELINDGFKQDVIALILETHQGTISKFINN